MPLIKPSDDQDKEEFFWVVTCSGDTITRFKNNIYSVPLNVIGLLEEKEIKFIVVSPIDPKKE